MNISDYPYDLSDCLIPIGDGSISPKQYGQYLQNKRKSKKRKR